MYTEIQSQFELGELISKGEDVKEHAFQALSFLDFEDLKVIHFTKCLFLGCDFPDDFIRCNTTDSLFFPKIHKPFLTFPNTLYSVNSLMGDYVLGNPNSYKNTYDYRVYEHYIHFGKEAEDIGESLARRLHDHSITDALLDLLNDFDEKKVVAVMGGHSLSRSDPSYTIIAEICKNLAENGYLVTSGGGPGAMEATHLGAWFAGGSLADLHSAIEMLAEAPSYKDPLWLDLAFEVMAKYPKGKYDSLGIPTWLYGHEPPTPFATKIAKYFANSVREDGLLAIAKGGVIFAPGSAGTIQEIFQDATQNHYLNFGYASPMIFLNKEYWMYERPIFPLLLKMSDEGKYKNLILSACDTEDEVVTELKQFNA